MDVNAAKERIAELVAKYQAEAESGKLKKYTEEDVKKGFIIPFFEAFGWDSKERSEVSSEESIQSTGRVDYGFYSNNQPRFYLEAKKPSADIHDEAFARQAIRYSWNRGVTWAVLTNFDRLLVFNAQDVKSSLHNKLLFDIPYSEYVARFDDLALLSKESFATNALDAYAEKIGKKFQRIPITFLLYKDLDECRELLTKSLAAWNKEKLKGDPDLLDEGVQKLLDRLIFIRVAEDRGVEPPTLLPLIRAWEASKERNEIPLYTMMVGKFRELDKTYDSNLFSEHPFETWEEYNGATEEVIKILYGKQGYYEYDFKAMPADVLGTVYENYLGHRLSQSKKGVTLAKDAGKRKEQGIYYTPAFIVDYIVKHALQPVLDKCKTMDALLKIKVLDPACGSGSFLIKALEVLNEKYKSLGAPGDEMTKFLVLTNNLYGVDLDEKAVEIARLNLLINSLDGKIKLPYLSDHIKCGNSLISGTDEELKKYFGINFKEKKPFNWKEEFPTVFAQGGFDVVIGNPPYLKELDNKELFQEIRKSDFGKYYQGKMDFWYFFLHRAIDVVRDGGMVAFITNSYFLKSAGATKLIDHLQDEMVLVSAVDFQDIKVFEDVSGRHLIHIWKKTKDKNNATTKYVKVDKNSFNGIIDDSSYTELAYVEVIKNSSINFEANIQTISENTILLGDLYDVSQGVVEATDKVSKKMAIGNFESGNGVFVLSEQELQKLNLDQKEKQLIKKYLNTNDVRKYYIDFSNEYLIYSDKEEKIKIAEGEYPHIKSHLDKMRQFITSSNVPYGLHRPRENKYFENPKLICKGMFLSPEFCFDDEKYYVGFSFSVIIQKDKSYDLKYLLGLLNSSFGKNWFNVNGKKRGVGVDIGVAAFRNFPVCRADKAEQTQIATMVNKMLLLNKELHAAEENSNEWERIKSEIAKTDKKIDEEVYKLYGLTPDEIAIVEKGVA